MPERLHALREAQRWLAGLILEPEAVDHAAVGPIAAPPRGTVGERLRAYVDGYPARLHEALAESFPALAHLLGTQAFAALGRRYRPAVPAGSYSLGDVGRNLPAWLEHDEVGRAYPFAPDLARLEWAIHGAFHASPGPPFDPATVAGWRPEAWAQARVRFQAGTTVLASPWPVCTLWRARDTARDEIDIEVAGRPETVLVHRIGWRVACETIGADEAAVLAGLLAGRPLGQALADVAPDRAEAVAGWTAGWVRRAIVVACER